MATYAQLVQFPTYWRNGVQCTSKVYHYIVGTTTLKDVYVDREKGSTAAQPVVSDANGVVSFYADGLYKFVIDVATDGSTYSTLYTYDKWAVGDLGIQIGEGAAITAASTLVLGTDGDFFHVTGSTGITAISGTQSRVTLVFDSTPTMTYSGNLILRGAINYTVVAGDVFTFVNDGAGVWREVSRTPPYGTLGAAGTIPIVRTLANSGITYQLALNKVIYGLTYANGTDAVNDININTGACMDATGAFWMTVPTALGKQSDVAWAVGGTTGTPLGFLDTGSVGNNDYYIWLIARSDTNVTDALCSLSATAPTMPANYDYKRLIGWFKRVGGTVVAFHTYEVEGGGIQLMWDVPTQEVSLTATLTSTRRTDAMKVPLDFSVLAHLNVILTDGAQCFVLVVCPDMTDAAPSASAAPGFTLGCEASTFSNYGCVTVRTSAAGLVASRSSAGTTADTFKINTLGFTWARRN